MNHKRTITAAVTVAFLASMAIVPTAQAQVPTPIFTIDSINVKGAELRPGLDVVNVDVSWTWNPGNALQNLAAGLQPTVPVTWSIGQCDPNIIIAGSFSDVITLDPTQIQGNEYTGIKTFQISLRNDAPGLSVLACEMRGQTEDSAGGTVPASPQTSSRFQVTGAFVPKLQANVAQKIQQGGPQKEVAYPIEITNFGNAKTTVLFNLDIAPEGGKWAALPPESIILNSEQSGLTFSTNINFVVSTTYKNGWNNELGAYTLSMTPFAFIDESKTGVPERVNILTKVRGVYVPTLEPIIMLGALLGSAFMLKMRREEEE